MTQLISFFKESYAELKQVSWLTTPQMIASTWVVLILVAILALYIFVVEAFLKVVIGSLI